MKRALALIEEDTAAGWAARNPILEDGVFAVETSSANNYSTARLKKGDGIRPYNSLPYIGGGRPPRISYADGDPLEQGYDSSNSFGGDTHFDGGTGEIYYFWDAIGDWAALPSWPVITFGTTLPALTGNVRLGSININPTTGAVHQITGSGWVFRLTLNLAT